ncbi:hypothetical protein EVAR_44029_1 [Eumeta japonica]|uniref:Uncharacterized protein n=1 Tax=Eumeta variegata TaxID=151549 RepID=A0A4C1XGG2_EUMVA|nr:hypothetical protein EVAR_44029_1 [Eumeta japonica]
MKFHSLFNTKYSEYTEQILLGGAGMSPRIPHTSGVLRRYVQFQQFKKLLNAARHNLNISPKKRENSLRPPHIDLNPSPPALNRSRSVGMFP